MGRKKSGNSDQDLVPQKFKRSKSQIELDRADMARMLARGMNQQLFHDWLHKHRSYRLTAQQISLDWRQVLKELKERRVTDVETLQAIKEQEYAWVKNEAIGAWENSKPINNEVNDEGEIEINTKQRGPNNEYLRTVVTVLQAEREMMGIDSPKKKVEVQDDSIYIDALLPAVKQVLGGLINNAINLNNKDQSSIEDKVESNVEVSHVINSDVPDAEIINVGSELDNNDDGPTNNNENNDAHNANDNEPIMKKLRGRSKGLES